jgi:LuxR family transcriptional regulator, maltose regulon positive regulatory protein
VAVYGGLVDASGSGGVTGEPAPRADRAVPADGLWFALLGPVRGWLDGVEVELGSPDQRAVLACLLLWEGRPAMAGEIIDAVWGEDAPRSVQGVLRTYVYRLRRLFAGMPGGAPLIQSVGGGYVLPAAGESVDARIFQQRVAEGRRARQEGDPARAAALLGEGLALWQGTPLSGMRGLYADRQRQRLEQLQEGAREEYFAADIERGAHREVIPALTQAVADNPLRERLSELLMLAQYRAGRQAEALDVYSDAYRVLDEELGIAPGAALRELHGAILRADPGLELLTSHDRPRPPAVPAPAQLPPDIPDFTGRVEEIAEITQALSRTAGQAPLVGLTGLGGMGKSALAVHAARLLSGQFSGGQVYADLGAGRDAPADPAEVLAGFLRACGVRTADIPPGLDERAALWRTILASRDTLVLLDDAADGEQVRHLLPATAGSAGIITSGRRLAGLPGVSWIKVDAMTEADSVMLLGAIAGADRVAAEPGPARRLAAACSCQPLAVRVAAARLLDRPSWSVAQVAAQLEEDLRNPVVMQDDCVIVDRPLERAQNRLDDATAAGFRLLAVPDSDRLTAPSAAAALGLPENEALAVLERLADAHLLTPGPDRTYRYHGLVQAYARRQARALDGPERCREVLRGSADYYIATARAAVYDTASSGPARTTVPARRDVLAILAQTQDLPGQRGGRSAAPSPPAAAARTLPRDVASFTGRQQELEQLAEVAAGAAGVVAIHAIGGMAGVGKTAFAVHAAHRLADQYPGGQIFLPLHGHTPGQRPVDPADALASLLVTAGAALDQLPPGLEARMRLWRDRVAGRRLLLVLDDAVDSEQVLPLLPGSAGSLVLVTSRRHLSALEDATAVSLDTLPPGEAAALLVRLAGRPELSAGHPGVAELARLCGYLPLALGMVGRQLHHHPAWSVAGWAAELATARDRLELMATENVSAAAAFDLSYADLTTEQRRLFRRLILHPGAEFDVYSAAALDDTGVAEARRGLAGLYDHYLLTEPARGRYRMHDLIREHARTLADQDDPDGDRERATARLLDYYQHAAARAAARIDRQTRPGRAAADDAVPVAVPDLNDQDEALAWARAERASLTACLDQATGSGQDARVIALTAGLAGLLRRDGPMAEALTRHETAIGAAERLGDRLGQANALRDLGTLLRLTDDYPAAVHAHEQALEIYRDLGDRLGQAGCFSELGNVRRTTGYYPAAYELLEQALDIYHDIGDRPGQAHALTGLGVLQLETCNYPPAVQALEQALEIYRDIGDRLTQAGCLNALGSIRRRMGDCPAAVQAHEQAMDIHRDLGNRAGQAGSLSELGIARRMTGDYPAAVQVHEQALAMYRDLGDRIGEANALSDLGIVWRMTGDYPAAVQVHEQALAMYRDLGNRPGEANALRDLGSVGRMTGDHPAAVQALEQALGMYRDLGNRAGEADALTEMGALHLAGGTLAEAEECYRQALDLARAIASSWSEAHALAGLGRCFLASGQHTEAEALLRQALEIFQRAGAPEADEVCAELTPLAGPRDVADAPADQSPAPSQPATAARTLPRDVASFTGRQRELERLAEAAAGAVGVVAIHAIGGMAGVGKTAFAVHAAHRLADRFPDGQIFLPLHGHTPGQEPVDPADALASLLLTVGAAPGQIPSGLEARMGLWRDRVAGRQLLLILDDAVDSVQVLPLLPASGGCLVLVTSRRHLLALEDATAVSLDTLPAAEAGALLARLAGRAGLGADDPGVAELARVCGYLPLAIGMVARQLHHHPAWSVAGRAAELSTARDRLGLMATENLSVAAAFDLSYADLTTDQQRLFRRLGLHPGAEFDGYAAAALDGTGLAEARRDLEGLCDQYLLIEPARGRYRMHDLIREHARALAVRDDPHDDRERAAARLLDYYQHAAARADVLIARQTRPGSVATGATRVAVPALADLEQALAWARTERASLIACLDHAVRAGQDAQVIAVTAGISGLLDRDGPWADAILRHSAAIAAARSLGDRLGQANALQDLGSVRRRTGDFPAAARDLEEALGIYRDLGDRLGQANALNCLGAVRNMTGDYPTAAVALAEALDIYRDVGDRGGEASTLRNLGAVQGLTCDFPAAVSTLEESLEIYRDLGDRLGQGGILNYLGIVRRLLGDYPAAAQAQEQALHIYRDLGDRHGQANVLSFLGVVRQLTGDHQSAAPALAEALDIYRELGDRVGHATALLHLGALRRSKGDYPAAVLALDEALGIYRDLGDRGGEAEALNERGTLHRISGELARAEECHQQALDLARSIAVSLDEAHALAGLGRCALAGGQHARAQTLLGQALEIFQRVGAPEAGDVSGELTALTRGGPPATQAPPDPDPGAGGPGGRSAPVAGASTVIRPELLRRLGGSARVSVVSAPPGSGKTILLRSWIARAGIADSVGWVAAGRDDRDPQLFWLSVVNALRRTAPGSALVHGVTAAPELDGWAVVERLLRNLAALREPVWLVIDDAHELGPEVMRQLELLVLRAPPRLRFVLATRQDVRLGLHRLRLEGGLAEIRAADLRFCVGEAAELLAAAGLDISDSAVALLHERTEGWAAGLRLAALSLAGHPDPERFAKEFSGSDRTVAEYLLAEVLDRQPEPVRRLLLRTSILERVNGQLADLLTGDDDGERVLHDLADANAFVLPVDGAHSWFRYHQLFAGLLTLELRRTEPGQVTGLHRAASQWFAAHGYPVEAIRHAQAAEDWDRAAGLLADHWPGLHLDGQDAITHALLAGFPAHVLGADAELGPLIAADELAFGTLDGVERHLGLAESAAAAPEARPAEAQLLLGIVRLLVARQRGNLLAETREAQRLRTMAEVPAAAVPALGEELRALALISLGYAEGWTARSDPTGHLEQGVTLARRAGRSYLEFTGLAYQSAIEASRSLPGAEEHSRQAIELAERHGWSDETAAGVAYTALGGALAWQGRLDDAETWLHRADLSIKPEAEAVAALAVQYIRGQLLLARGQAADALAAFEAAGRLAGRLAAPHPFARPARAWIVSALACLGETERADKFLAELDERERESGGIRIATAVLRLAQDNPGAALSALDPVLDGSVRVGWQTWLVEAFLLAAIAQDALDDPEGAEGALERALDLAESGGTLLWFLLHPVPELLKRLIRNHTAHSHLIAEIKIRLAEMHGGIVTSRAIAGLTEPMSESELRVLRYLPTTLTVPEIAGELFVSRDTVQTHLRELYAKLGTRHRAEAVERARDLGLLAPSAAGLNQSGRESRAEGADCSSADIP